jgi:hypothetical protein
MLRRILQTLPTHFFDSGTTEVRRRPSLTHLFLLCSGASPHALWLSKFAENQALHRDPKVTDVIAFFSCASPPLQDAPTSSTTPSSSPSPDEPRPPLRHLREPRRHRQRPPQCPELAGNLAPVRPFSPFSILPSDQDPSATIRTFTRRGTSRSKPSISL